MISKQSLAEHPGKIAVTFSVPASIWADHVHLVGDFNQWDATATPMRCGEEGWSATLVLDVDGIFGYSYLLDGHTWMCDSNADAYTRSDAGVVISMLTGAAPAAEYRAPGLR